MRRMEEERDCLNNSSISSRSMDCPTSSGGGAERTTSSM